MSADSRTRTSGALAALTLAAIGVVYGDIGTSPLYAMKLVFAHGRSEAAGPPPSGGFGRPTRSEAGQTGGVFHFSRRPRRPGR